MVSTILQLLGVALIVGGVALLSIPAAVIAGGLALVLIGLAVSR
jgi:hypothetical protein